MTAGASLSTRISTKKVRAPVGVSPDFVVHGLNIVVAGLATAGPRARAEMDNELEAAARELARDMRASVPRDENATHDSISASPVASIEQLKRGRGDDEAPGAGWVVGPGTFYSRFLVYGTAKMAPQWDPFTTVERHVNRLDRAARRLADDVFA